MNEGDDVTVDQTVAVVETHKAAIDVRSPVAGKAVQRHVNEGDIVYEVQPILTVLGTWIARHVPGADCVSQARARRASVTRRRRLALDLCLGFDGSDVVAEATGCKLPRILHVFSVKSSSTSTLRLRTTHLLSLMSHHFTCAHMVRASAAAAVLG